MENDSLGSLYREADILEWVMLSEGRISLDWNKVTVYPYGLALSVALLGKIRDQSAWNEITQYAKSALWLSQFKWEY